MKPHKLSAKALKMLSDFHKAEYTAHYTYRYRGNCLKGQGYNIAAEFFYKEAEEELKHAKIIEDYVAQWNGEVLFSGISAPTEAETVDGIIEDGYTMEFGLLNKYKHGYVEFMEAGDTEHAIFLQQFIKIQNKAVGEYSDKLNMLELFDKSSPSWVFQFEKKLFK